LTEERTTGHISGCRSPRARRGGLLGELAVRASEAWKLTQLA
jgi:hypothetical protein